MTHDAKEMTMFIDIEKEKILLAYNSKLRLHIKKKNKDWRNGYVREIQADFFLFEDDQNGIEPIFWIELLKVDPYINEREIKVEVEKDGGTNAQ